MITRTKNIIHYKIKSTIKGFVFKKKQSKLRKRILKYYLKFPTDDADTNNALNYLSTHKLSNFYSDFQEKYDYRAIEVFIDEINTLPYVMVNENRLYFKRSYNKRTVQLTYNELMIEQDMDSPHCYSDYEFNTSNSDILADVGCAEGYFSLLNIEKLQKVYLFEQDVEWAEALEATFSPWKDKVEVIRKFVSNTNNENEVRLYDYFLTKTLKPNFYKIDVEGAEMSVLNGMKDILCTSPLKIAICTYHNQNDFEDLSQLLMTKDFRYRANKGVMIFQNDIDIIQPPFFRKCLIKAER